MTRKRSSRFSAAMAAALALPISLVALTADGYKGSSVSNGGTITGTITYSGKTSTKKMEVTKDHDVCGDSHMDESIVVNGKKLKNVVVYLDGIEEGKSAGTAAPVLDQKKCTYVPHVQAATKGSTLELRNNDPILHNVYGKLDGKRTLFNIGMPKKGQVIKKTLKKTGVVTVSCDAGHTWMSAYIVVLDHPYYAVTGADGSFTLDDVPAGTYKLVAWHEELGTKEATVTVAANGSVTSDVKF